MRGLLSTEALVANYTAEELTAFVEAGNPLCVAQRKLPKNAGKEMRTQRSPPEIDEPKGQRNDISQDTSFRGRAKVGCTGLSKRGRQIPQYKRQKKAEGNEME